MATMGANPHHDDWRERNLSTLVLALVRALRDPALAWDVATEAMAASTLVWATFPGGSRMAWVLEHGHRIVREAQASGRVSSQARERNGAAVAKTLSTGEQQGLRELAGEPLHVDPDASATVDALARDAPPPNVLLDIALSRLTIRGARELTSSERDDG
jgi:hypothetical protein